MELQSPRISDVSRGLEPLRGLDAILSTTNEGNNTLRVKATSVSNSLEENAIEVVDLCAVLGSVRRRFIDRLECNQTRFTAQLGANLEPKPVKLLLDLGDIGAGDGNVRPFPGVCHR